MVGGGIKGVNEGRKTAIVGAAGAGVAFSAAAGSLGGHGFCWLLEREGIEISVLASVESCWEGCRAGQGCQLLFGQANYGNYV
jgi:hypothetical protein